MPAAGDCWMDEIEEEAPPRGEATKKALIAALTKFVKVHNSVQGYDKTVKLFYYALPLAASTLRSIYKDSPLAEGLAAIGSHLGMYRISTRFCGGFFGLPAEAENLLTDSWDGGWDNPVIRRIVRWQSWSMIAYYPMEHLAWFVTLAPKLFPNLDLNKLWRVACYFWVFWLLVDIYATRARWRELDLIEAHLRSQGLLDETRLAVLKTSRASLRRYMTRIALYLPNALHWCVDTIPGNRWCLPATAVNLFGLAEGLVGSYAFCSGDSTSRPKF